MTERMLYRMFSLGRNFVSRGLLCTLKCKKPKKNFFQKPRFFSPGAVRSAKKLKAKQTVSQNPFKVPVQSCPWVGLTHGLGWVGSGSRIIVILVGCVGSWVWNGRSRKWNRLNLFVGGRFQGSYDNCTAIVDEVVIMIMMMPSWWCALSFYAWPIIVRCIWCCLLGSVGSGSMKWTHG